MIAFDDIRRIASTALLAASTLLAVAGGAEPRASAAPALAASDVALCTLASQPNDAGTASLARGLFTPATPFLATAHAGGLQPFERDTRTTRGSTDSESRDRLDLLPAPLVAPAAQMRVETCDATAAARVLAAGRSGRINHPSTAPPTVS